VFCLPGLTDGETGTLSVGDQTGLHPGDKVAPGTGAAQHKIGTVR
jgi:hypothetical protein